jgi:hypothetical protein
MVMRQADMDPSGLAVEPQPRPAVDAGAIHFLSVPEPEFVRRAEIGRGAVAVQGNHRIRKMPQRQRALVLDAPHRLR